MLTWHLNVLALTVILETLDKHKLHPLQYLPTAISYLRAMFDVFSIFILLKFLRISICSSVYLFCMKKKTLWWNRASMRENSFFHKLMQENWKERVYRKDRLPLFKKYSMLFFMIGNFFNQHWKWWYFETLSFAKLIAITLGKKCFFWIQSKKFQFEIFFNTIEFRLCFTKN